MPNFNRDDTQAILAFFGQSSTTNRPRPTTTNTSTADILRPVNNTPRPRPTANSQRPTASYTPPASNKQPVRYDPLSSAYTNQAGSAYATGQKKVKPSAPKIKRPSASSGADNEDAFMAALNRWRDSNQDVQINRWQGPQQKPVSLSDRLRPPTTGTQRFDPRNSQVDFSFDRPDTGVNAMQQSGIVGAQTVKGPPAQPLYDPLSSAYQPKVMQRPTTPYQDLIGDRPLLDPERGPRRYTYPDIEREQGPTWGERLSTLAQNWMPTVQNSLYPLYGGFQAIGNAFQDSAAAERAQFDIAQRNEQFAQRPRSTLGDLGQAFGNAWDATTDNWRNAFEEGQQYFTGQQDIGQTAGDLWEGSRLGEYLATPWTAADISGVTADLGRRATNTLSGLQSGFDFIYNKPVVNNTPLSVPIAAGIDQFVSNLQAFYADPVKSLTGQNEQYKMFGNWLDAVGEQMGAYQRAVQPTAQQAKTMTADELRRQQERAYLNTLGGVQSLEQTFDALVDQGQTVNQLWADAKQNFIAGANTPIEEERQAYWYKAAQASAQAYKLQNTHPVELVHQNTNLLRQLATEVLLPDITDLAAGIFSLVGATPKARRLTTVAGEVLTPEQQAMDTLRKMIIDPANQAKVMAERSNYNKWWNLWTTGNARATMAADKMQRYVTNLLTEVDTVSDAKVLLNQLAVNPTRLIEGVRATFLQSPALLARATEDGIIRFGTMGLDNLREPLRIYQQAAKDFLAKAQSLQKGPLLNKADFMVEFTDAMKMAGYKYYNVVVDTPAGAPSAIKQAGDFMRKAVSPFYILGSPGTWVTNIVGGMAHAMGDGVWSAESVRAIDGRISKLFGGIDPTMRGMERAATTLGFAQQALAGGVFKHLRNLYSGIDERAGKKVFMAAVDHALRRTGKPILQQTLTPILQDLGVTNMRQARKIVNHLFEVGYRGGNMAEEWARLMAGNARLFSLSDVNPTWLGAIPEERLEQFYDILKAAPDKATATAQLQEWGQNVAKYWDDLLATQTPTPARQVWMSQEVAQDAADLTQSAKMATKYGNVPAEEAAQWVKTTRTAMDDAKQRMATLMQVVADSQNPQHRYALYNLWGEITDLTANVRAQLTELAEAAGSAPKGAERQAAWADYWTQARRLWDERNTAVTELLERTNGAIQNGADFTPQLDTWRLLERTAQVNEQKLWDALRLEPQSGAYDARLKTVIDAGRAVADKAMARVYAAARRFANVDAMDYILSAEGTNQLAGAKARAYLDRVLEQVINSKKPNWERYFEIRNEVWRQLRAYERDIWGIAERNIVRDGLANEAQTGLRFDAGPDGVVELVRPEKVPTQKTNKLSGETAKTTEDKAYWLVKREDGTITRVPENMVPEELKARYNGLTPEEIDAQVTLEMDNIASSYPYADDAQKLLNGEEVSQVSQPAAEVAQEVVTPAVTQVAQQAVQATQQAVEQVAPVVRATVADLRKLAGEVGIATISEKGKPFDTALVNTVKKLFRENNIPLTIQRLAELTQEQLDTAMRLLSERKDISYAGEILSAEKKAARDTMRTLALTWDDAVTAELGYPPLEELAKQYKAGQRAFDLEDLYGLTVAGQRFENSDDVARYIQQYVKLQEQAATATEGVKATQRYAKMSKQEILRERGADLIAAGFDEVELAQRSRFDILRFLEELDNKVGRDPNIITYEFTIPLLPDKAIRDLVGKELNLGANLKPGKVTTVGDMVADVGQGAAFAKQQVENILRYTLRNLDEILTPVEGLGQGQSLRAIDDFRRNVLPQWDNAKYIASEYGNRMRSFALIDFANTTRLDELLGLYMPYGFWMTRTAKNSLERAIFEPHLWRRVMQADEGIRDMQEQRGDPQRYEGGIPYDTGNGITQYLRLLPSKYWPAFGLFTHNDYADPESANSALGFAVESLRSANLNSYPWWDALSKVVDGRTGDLFPVNYTPQTRILSDMAVKVMGANVPRWMWTGYLDNTAARVLNNMAVKGEITNEEARWAHQYIRQLTTGEAALPEQQALDQEKMQAIVMTALQQAAGADLWPAVSSFLTGVSVKPFDQAENVWRGAQQEYYANQYDPVTNPYGSHLASQATRDDAALNWSKSAVMDTTRTAPGVMMATDAKRQAKEDINADLMSATEAWLATQKSDPTNGEINDFKTDYINKKLKVSAAYYGDAIADYLDDTYPSAQAFSGEKPSYKGYAPEELREKAKVAAYYQAKDEIQAPVYPGDKASREEYKAYFEAKANYEQAIEDRVTALIADPVAMRQLVGLVVTNAPTSISDYLRSNSADTFNMDNAFGYPVRPTGEEETLTGLLKLEGSPEDAETIILGERTKYMGDLEKEIRARNAAKGDRSGYSRRGRGGYSRRYYSRRRRGGRGGSRRYYGGGGAGGGGGFRYIDINPQEMSGGLWNTGQMERFRPWNNNANDWLYAGKELKPGRMEDWRPIRLK